MRFPNQSAGVARSVLVEPVLNGIIPQATRLAAPKFTVGRIASIGVGPIVIGGGGGTAYKCDSETDKCTCSGALDCFAMAGSGVCDSNEPLVCTNGSCDCTWKN